MKTVTLKLPDALFNEIEGTARARNVSKSEVIRERLGREIAGNGKKGTADSLWRRMKDVVIQTDSLPADLSSNNAHLKGYGASRSHR